MRLDTGITAARYTVVNLTEEAPELVSDLLTYISENVQAFFGDNETGVQQLIVPAGG